LSKTENAFRELLNEGGEPSTKALIEDWEEKKKKKKKKEKPFTEEFKRVEGGGVSRSTPFSGVADKERLLPYSTVCGLKVLTTQL